MKNNNSTDTTENLSHDQTSSDSNLQKCVQDLEQTQERLRYLMAEFDNYKKRTEKERTIWIDSSRSEVLRDLLTLVDDFDRALGYTATNQEKSIREGVELMYKTLYKILSTYKVEEMVIEKEFDPEKHEALMQVASADHKSGEIVSVLQKGFMYKNTVLRPAKVTVAQ